jgi:hypothetical protein
MYYKYCQFPCSLNIATLKTTEKNKKDIKNIEETLKNEKNIKI